MVSQGGSPPIAMPVQVPPGHVMQQIVDESGTLRHVILSTAQQQQMPGQTGVQGVQSHMHFVSIITSTTLHRSFSEYTRTNDIHFVCYLPQDIGQ